MAVTIKDIAVVSGYSRGTVDRALNDKPRISDKTKSEIKRIADEMGYKPDLIARSLVSGVTMTIGVVVFDISNRYFALLLNAIEKAAKLYNYSVIIMLQENDPKLELKVLDDLANRKVDGIILCPVNKGPEFVERIKKMTMPVITVGNYISDEVYCIGINEMTAADQGTRFIISKGYEKIIFVCPYLEDEALYNIYVHEQRLKGFKNAMSDFSTIEYDIIAHRKDVYQISQYLSEDKKTALFCSGDMLALDIMKALRKQDIEAPKDYGIMGFDGLDILDYVTPSLTTISTPIDLIGIEAFEDLFKMIDKKKIREDRKLSFTLVEGETIV